jgi:transcriptional regulator with XRE-family HTH domain
MKKIVELSQEKIRRSKENKVFPQRKDIDLSNKKTAPKKRRNLSSIERDEQMVLKKIWEDKHIELNLTQANVAKQFGYKNQAAISQYLNGKIPLNMETVVKFAQVLRVAVEEISPRFANNLPDLFTSGLVVKVSNLDTLQFVKALNDSMAPNICKGDLMVIDSAESSAKGIQLPTGKIVAVFRNIA